eukprot:jgi/Bigna1/74590/fgenesh1_pg.30_\
MGCRRYKRSPLGGTKLAVKAPQWTNARRVRRQCEVCPDLKVGVKRGGAGLGSMVGRDEGESTITMAGFSNPIPSRYKRLARFVAEAFCWRFKRPRVTSFTFGANVSVRRENTMMERRMSHSRSSKLDGFPSPSKEEGGGGEKKESEEEDAKLSLEATQHVLEAEEDGLDTLDGLQYLYTTKHKGVREYIIEKFENVPEAEIEFFLPQLCHMFSNMASRDGSEVLEFLAACSAKSAHFCLKAILTMQTAADYSVTLEQKQRYVELWRCCEGAFVNHRAMTYKMPRSRSFSKLSNKSRTLLHESSLDNLVREDHFSLADDRKGKGGGGGTAVGGGSAAPKGRPPKPPIQGGTMLNQQLGKDKKGEGEGDGHDDGTPTVMQPKSGTEEKKEETNQERPQEKSQQPSVIKDSSVGTNEGNDDEASPLAPSSSSSSHSYKKIAVVPQQPQQQETGGGSEVKENENEANRSRSNSDRTSPSVPKNKQEAASNETTTTRMAMRQEEEEEQQQQQHRRADSEFSTQSTEPRNSIERAKVPLEGGREGGWMEDTIVFMEEKAQCKKALTAFHPTSGSKQQNSVKALVGGGVQGGSGGAEDSGADLKAIMLTRRTFLQSQLQLLADLEQISEVLLKIQGGTKQLEEEVQMGEKTKKKKKKGKSRSRKRSSGTTPGVGSVWETQKIDPKELVEEVI